MSFIVERIIVMEFCPQRNPISLIAARRCASAFSISHLHLAWLGDEYVSTGFRSYVRPSPCGNLVASGAGNVLEIYERSDMALRLRHETDTSSCWCMSWLPENRYVTGSNDSLIRIWDEGNLRHTLKGHSDWIRSLSVIAEGTKMISGSMDASLVLWNLPELRAEWSFQVPASTPALNSVMAVDWCSRLSLFVAVTREGRIAMLDPKSPRPLLAQYCAHTAKTNHLEISRSDTHLLTSARDNSCKLWDLRQCKLPLVTYNQHKCAMYPIPGRLYMDEKYVLTGDDEDGLVIYETDSGKVFTKLHMNSGVSLTEPMDASDPDIYCVLVQQQKLAILESGGNTYIKLEPSPADLQAERVKNAMQKSIWKFNEHIFHHLRAIGRFNTVGYGSLLDVLQNEAGRDEGCRKLITEINEQFSAYLLEPTTAQSPPSLSDLSPVQADSSVLCNAKRCSLAPRVRVEKETHA